MRLGFHVGPFSVGASDREVASVAEVAIVATIAFVVIGWPLSLLGHAIGLTPSWHQLLNEDQAWLRLHYPKLGLRYLAVVALIAGTVLAPVLAYIGFSARRDLRRGTLFTSRAAEDRHLRSMAEQQAAEVAARRARLAVSRAQGSNSERPADRGSTPRA